MPEHVLQFDSSVVPQETFYDCAPASTQVVLNDRGIIVSESDLVGQIGTTENGTDDISWVLRALQPALPQAVYAVAYMPNDPPTAAQRSQLWSDIVRSIDAGYGVVMNWEAPPSNYPIGVKGSQSPAYSGGTVFHYVACMGYDDTNNAVLIADPGFQPFVYWISFDQCASLIPPKGYAFSSVNTEVVPTPAEDPAQILSDAMKGALSLDRYRQLLPSVSEALIASECTTSDRIAMWCAQIGEESGGLYYTEEIASGAEYEGRPDLGNTETGDGVRFKGRSWIQITGRNNYTQLSAWAYAKGLVPSATYFVDNPTELAADQYAGLGPAWYWTVARPDINALSDAHDVYTVTLRINGGTNGLADRTSRYNNALAMGDQLLQLISAPAAPAGGNFLMALTDDEQAELLDLARQVASYQRVSRSPLRWPGEGPVDTIAGLAWNSDANLHVLLTEKLAVEYGDPQSISLLYAVSTNTDPARASDAELASRILAKVDYDKAAAVKSVAAKASN